MRMDRKELASTLLELLEEETGETYPELDDATTLRDGLHLDSVDMVSLVLHVETRLNLPIDSAELQHVVTVGDLLNLLERKQATSDRQHAA
jgi:acyl carrier protein